MIPTEQQQNTSARDNEAGAPARPHVYGPRGNIPYRLVCWTFQALGKFWLHHEIIGLENIPPTGPALILPTHTSYLDPMTVGANMPREAHYIAREGILKIPLVGWTLQHRLNTHPIRRGASDREAIKVCRNVLKQGFPLIFFPEGTRSRDGKLGPIQGGFAMILDGVDAPYIPVLCQSSFRIFPRGAFFIRPRKLTIIYGKPQRLPARNEGEATRDYYKRCCEDLERVWREMGAQ